MSEPSARQRFVEAMRLLYDKACAENIAHKEAAQAADAFADVECGVTDKRVYSCPVGSTRNVQPHTSCRATLRKEIGLE